ncbi:MAG: patatin family protein [Clostridiales bacterium]|nr:patatin family protein [Clostridiales bacterium]
MKALIDVGGGMRDVYGAGAMDCFMDNGIHFELCIGVSAGSANMSSFLSGQKGRNYKFYTEYAKRKEYMSVRNYIKNGSYFDLDYIYSELSNEDCENPLDYEKMISSPTEGIAVVTNARTGEAEYFNKSEMAKNDYWLMKASSAVPIICKPYKYNGNEYADGGISDPIPIQKAFDMGCDHAVVIIPRPFSEKKDSIGKYLKPFLKDYPALLDKLKHRMEIYNSELELLKNYEKQGKATLIVPDSDKGLFMATTNHEKLTNYYNKGYKDAKKTIGKF